MRRAPLPFAVLLAVSALASAPAAAEPLAVVASLPPLALLAGEVMGDRGEVVRIGADGAGHEHGGRLRPSDARAIAGADLALWIGPSLEPTLVRAIGAVPALELGAADGVAPRLDARGTPDPHVWLSPANAIAMTDAIAATLAERDPDGADGYRVNAAALNERITKAGEEARDRLAALSGAPYAVDHDAFGHFGEWVGLAEPVAVRGRGARSLREAAEEARERGVECLVTEPGETSRLLAVLGTDARAVAIDPLGRDARSVPDLIERVAAGFATCLAPTG